MLTAILKGEPQLQTWWKEEARAKEQRNSVRSINISQDQFVGKGEYAELQRQPEFNDLILDLCCLAVLNAWYKVEKSQERSESFIKIFKVQKLPSLIFSKD